MTISWNEAETLAAAEKASKLSDLLEQENLFKQNALRWLDHRHIEKFFKTIDAAESARLRHYAEALHYTGSETETRGFPLLDWLLVIGRAYGLERTDLNTSADPGAGRKLVARLAELEPDWVGRWLRWRRANGKGLRSNLTPVEDAVINALTQSDLEPHLSVFKDEIVAAIIGRKPEFIEILPPERQGFLLRLALDKELQVSYVVEALSKHGIPSDAIAVIDGIFGSGNQAGVISQLDELVKEWQCVSGPDPVAVAITNGHERLDALLRSPWHPAHQSSGSRSDDNLWSPVLYGPVGRAFASAARVAPDRFRLELGYSIGLRIAEAGEDPSPEKISEHLERVGIDKPAKMADVLLPMVKLWAALRTLAKYQANSWEHETELVGLRAKIASLASVAPDLWAQSLPWVLARSSKLGEVAQGVTLELATTTLEVRSALESACNDKSEPVRLKALGLWTLLHGLEDPESGLARTLADAAAHHMDGTPVFPHPLAPVSATWLSSIGVERAIADGVRRATTRFAAEVREQGGDIEEALTKALIKEIEVEFREVRPKLKLFGSTHSRSPAPILSVRQRPTSKKSEEPVYGCDLAWLLNATVHGRFSATWVDLIQVKKSTALQRHGSTMSRADSWRIESKQLNDILKWSATAAYWLFASGGEVLAVPAKHLLAIKRGTKKSVSAETFTVGYHEVRSVAIPLEQYLVDLLIGQWVGTSSEDVVRFARGDNSNIRPRVVVEVTISIGQDNQ